MQEGAPQKDTCFTEEMVESRSSERVEAQVFGRSVFEGLKIISAGKDEGRERVPVL